MIVAFLFKENSFYFYFFIFLFKENIFTIFYYSILLEFLVFSVQGAFWQVDIDEWKLNILYVTS
jgi:hypothetical protein